jgi:Lantibiotic modifying enzyme
MGHTVTRREMLATTVAVASTLLLPRGALFAAPRGAPAATPPGGLDVALSAARWLRRARVETRNGATWPADPLKPASAGLDLFNGMPGVVLFYLELHDATQDAAWLEDARLGANELIARLPELQAAEACGFYDGLAGAAFVLEQTHRATGDGRYRDAAKRAIGMIHGLAHRTTSGAEWAGRSATPDIVSGSAGIGLFLLWADEVMDDPASRTLALATGRRLLETGTPARGGVKWVASGSTTSYPNFARGTAGVAFFLAELLRTMGDRTCMAGALTGMRYLMNAGNTESNGFKAFHHEPGGENLYHMGWCHGPAGSARLFQQLAIVTGREKWHDLANACGRSILASGAPERRSAGYWNNVGQCSGNAGIGEFFISLQRESPKPEYAAMIDRLTADTLTRATTDGDARKWVHVVDPTSPDVSTAHTGFMEGAAGIGTFFLHVDALAKGRRPAIHWPDSPWARPCVAPRATGALDMSKLNGGKSPSC